MKDIQLHKRLLKLLYEHNEEHVGSCFSCVDIIDEIACAILSSTTSLPSLAWDSAASIISKLILEGNVIIYDLDNEAEIKTNKIHYFKKLEEIKTFGETKIFIKDNYEIRSKNITFLDNIVGFDLFNVIGYSKKVVAFHGMMTMLASLFKKPVLDLFHFNINNWPSYRNARNFFYEFKPIYENYDFIIPKKNFAKTLKKMKFSFKV